MVNNTVTIFQYMENHSTETLKKSVTEPSRMIGCPAEVYHTETMTELHSVYQYHLSG